ncbi:hypothetical protein SS33_25200 [Enterobacter kobei]|nr:hypothetical protein SS33_25200 [Enterobacter kobei]
MNMMISYQELVRTFPKSIAFVTLSLLIWQGEAIIFPVIFSVTGSAACASMLKEKQPIARVFK